MVMLIYVALHADRLKMAASKQHCVAKLIFLAVLVAMSTSLDDTTGVASTGSLSGSGRTTKPPY